MLNLLHEKHDAGAEEGRQGSIMEITVVAEANFVPKSRSVLRTRGRSETGDSFSAGPLEIFFWQYSVMDNSP
jgi:hypothetical protein